jgi:hypothetical protein
MHLGEHMIAVQSRRHAYKAVVSLRPYSSPMSEYFPRLPSFPSRQEGGLS